MLDDEGTCDAARAAVLCGETSDRSSERLFVTTQASVILYSMQWSDLKHIADVRPIDDSDGDCLEEIRQVLARHGALSRFGVTLLHNHFEVAHDELMMETTDVDRREHFVRPVKRSWLDREGIQPQTTIVGFDESGSHQVCGCDPKASGHHHK